MGTVGEMNICLLSFRKYLVMKSVQLILISLFIIIGCGAPEKPIQNEAGIELNDGGKWKISEEMTPFIKEEEKLLETYIDGGDEDFKLLAEKLKENNSAIIANCKMKGKAHDELHKWLLPHIALVKELNNAESVKKSETVISDLQESFQTFNHFFE